MVSKDFRYNQKQVLLEHILRHIEALTPASLLDIGAGDGKLAIPLSKKTENYAAIESSHERVDLLRKAGLTVIEGIFPINVGGLYHMVLIVHSLPEKVDEVKPFLKAAWQLVNPSGVLLIITFKGSGGELTTLRNEINRGRKSDDDSIVEKMMATLEKVGVVKQEQIISTMQSPHIEDMIEVLSFSLGIQIGEKEKIEKLIHILNTRYKHKKMYSFPTPHLCIWVRKESKKYRYRIIE